MQVFCDIRHNVMINQFIFNFQEILQKAEQVSRQFLELRISLMILFKKSDLNFFELLRWKVQPRLKLFSGLVSWICTREVTMTDHSGRSVWKQSSTWQSFTQRIFTYFQSAITGSFYNLIMCSGASEQLQELYIKYYSGCRISSVNSSKHTVSKILQQCENLWIFCFWLFKLKSNFIFVKNGN